MHNFSSGELELSEYQDAVKFLENNLQLQGYSVYHVLSFEVSEKTEVKKKKLVEIIEGNIASLEHWLEHGTHTIPRLAVAHSFVSQYNSHLFTLFEQIERMTEIRQQLAKTALSMGGYYAE